MAKSILRTALRIQNTRDALLFGKTLSQEERSELRALLELLRYFKEYIDNEHIKLKIAFKIQFIHEAIEFGEKDIKMPYDKIAEEKFIIEKIFI